MRERDLAYEALAEATATDMRHGRGPLNAALKTIREQSEMDGPELAEEIRRRARMYRQAMPEVMLTAPALAKHWRRVFEEHHRAQGTNQSVLGRCQLCDGARFVPVGSVTIETNYGRSMEVEQWAPCPDCGPRDVQFYRHDGSLARCPDPARVREMMTG